jgi:hypothetical protein
MMSLRSDLVAAQFLVRGARFASFPVYTEGAFHMQSLIHRWAVAALLAMVPGAGLAQETGKKVDSKSDSAKEAPTPSPVPEKQGVVTKDARAMPGYTLINPMGSTKKTYLFDNDGRVVHSWASEHAGGLAAYLLDNGHLFRSSEALHRKAGFQGPAAGGRIQEFDWDGNLVWDFEYHSEKRLPHHDAIKLPNGNALLICWEMIDEKEAVAQGRRPETVKDSHLQPDCLVEIKPTGKTTGQVVWEWRSWDHLIQDRDKSKPNFGNVAEHPELFDVNYIHGDDDMVSKLMATKEGIEKLRALGYIGGAPAATGDAKKEGAKDKKERRPKKEPDWMHVNAVAYNAELDQIALSSPHFCEIWIIDHSTTTAEAKGHTGGRWGKGGDILYRWGNPRAYRNGTKLDQRLFYQHNIQWIGKGLLGQGHLLVFNNGGGRTPYDYSSVDEFVPPTDKSGNYLREKRSAFGPSKALWTYSAPNKKDFYSFFISGAQRLPNGNTLINSGAVGVVFEVTPEQEIVWKFVNPLKNMMAPTPSPGGPPKLVEVFSNFTRDRMGIKEEQRKKLDEVDNELNAKLTKILSAEQQKILAEPIDFDFSKFPPPGHFLSAFKRNLLKLSDTQSHEMAALQKDIDVNLEKILTDDQKHEIAESKSKAGGGGGGPPRTGNTLFRATRYEVGHPAFKGRTITPGKTLVEIQQEMDRPHE